MGMTTEAKILTSGWIPLRAAQAALLIAEELAGIAPSFPWMERAEAYAASLEELDAEIRALLSPIPEENRKLVTNHDSLGYFAHRYGFDVIATVIPGGRHPGGAELGRSGRPGTHDRGGRGAGGLRRDDRARGAGRSSGRRGRFTAAGGRAVTRDPWAGPDQAPIR